MLTTHSVKIQSVSELTQSIRGLLETEFPFVTVSGEISNLRKPYSGHLYFTLKDNNAQLRAVLFKQQQRYLDIIPANGLEVICRGRITLYEPRGEYQLLVDTIESLGAGQLQIAFDKLKSSLAQEGLFDQSAKQPLPFLPEKVTLITSPGGAAVHDFLQMAENRYPGVPIEVIPTRVQGEFAAGEIVEALTVLNQRKGTDVIILCRGGGSLEDLWAFNEEKVARAIYASKIPVVSAVGHEIDFTISDFVADFRAATPTGAAEAVIPDKLALLARINRANNELGNNLQRIIGRYRLQINTQERILGDPSILLTNFSLKLRNITTEFGHALKTRLNTKHQKLKFHEDSLRDANPGRVLTLKKQRIVELFKLAQLLIRLKIEKERDRFGKAAALLDAVSPLAVLGRGYSITRGKTARKVIRDSHELSVGEEIEVILDSGSLEAEVTRTKHRK
ncbi:MAG: exodeoxyribonuclease VII large subunit [Thermodesulfobacteriota bacterium]